MGGPQNEGAAHDAAIQEIYTFFVGLIAEYIEAYPLYRVKNDQ